MKVLIPEKLSKEGIDVLEQAGYEVTYAPETTPEQLVEIVGDYDALVVRSATTVTREVIEHGTNLKIIGRAGVGVDNIDTEAATERGIIVCNAPTSNVVSAAEQTMALMLCVARNTARADASMKAGKWNRSAFTGHELQNKTLAIFGLGHVGGLVAERARAFDMKLIGYDPYCSPERAAHLGVTLMEDVNEICKLADVITAHLPKTKETTGMFAAEQYALMKDGVYLINCARGGIFDIDSMADFLAAGKIGGAGIDVWENEPVTDSPLHEFENVVMTPHLGASTKEAQIRAAEQIAEYVDAGLQGKTVNTVVNAVRVPAEVMSSVGPFIPVCQKTGEVIAQLAGSAISKVRITVFGKLAESDPSVLGTATLAGVVSLSSEIPVNIINAEHLAKQRGVAVETATDPLSNDYPSYVEFTATSGGEEIRISSALVVGHEMPRIVGILGCPTDFIPGKHLIIMQYVDKPGRLGKIGTTLGDADFNVEAMQIASEQTGIATILMNVDQPIDKELQTRLQEAVEGQKAWFIEL